MRRIQNMSIKISQPNIYCEQQKYNQNTFAYILCLYIRHRANLKERDMDFYYKLYNCALS